MGFIDQFLISLSFQFKKVTDFCFQNVWKSIFYTVILVLSAGIMISTYRMTGSTSIEAKLANLPENYQISEDGATPVDDVKVIRLPQIDTLVIIGSLEIPISERQGLQNLVALGEKNWAFGRISYPVRELTYAQLPFLSSEEDGVLNREDLIELGKRIDESLIIFAPLYQYARVFLDLAIHFILISLLALAGRSFRKVVPITYKQAWIITSYGITAPLMFRTIIQFMELTIPILPLLYWMTVAFFSVGAIRNIGQSNQDLKAT